MNTLLTSKLRIPTSTYELVERPDLIERLNSGIVRRLSLVCAPAGFGKSSLASQWLRQFDSLKSTWLSLDETDNDLRTFMAYFVAAFQRIDDVLGAVTQTVLQSPQLPPIASLITPLLRDIAEVSGPCVLVLDDYHVIDLQDIHDVLAFILAHQPPQLHLVILSRSDPPLALGRLRAQGEIQEFRSADLRFNQQETSAFFQSAFHADLSSNEIAALESRTEGWIAGLQLAGLALQNQQNTHNFIQRFTGNHTYIVDYLGEEVLSQQPDSLRTFLLKTSILERFSPSLCDHVTGDSQSYQVLDELRQANLFLIELDHEQQWYRYHHLFSDFLRYQLSRADPDQVSVLHQRASHWFRDNGYIEEAVAHAISGKHYDLAAGLIETVAQSMIGQSRLDTVYEWIEAIPSDLVQQRPYLPLYQAWALNFSQNPPDIETYLRAAENALQKSGEEDDDIVGQIVLLRGYRLSRQGNPSEGIPLLQQSLDHLAQSSVMPRSVANLSLGIASWMQTSFAQAEMYFKQAISDLYMTIPGTEFPIGTAAGILADVHIQCGRLGDAKALGEEISANPFFQIHGKPLAVLGYTYARLGKILYERNQLDDCVEFVLPCIEMAEWIGDPELLIDSATTLALVQYRHGNRKEAQQLFDRVSRDIKDERVPFNAKITHNERLARCFPQQEMDAEWSVYFQDAVHSELPWYPLASFALARWEIYQKHTQDALDLLHQSIAVSQKLGARDWIIRGLVLQTMAYHQSRQTDLALDSLAQALSLAEPDGYVRTFVDEGATVGGLLTDLLAQYDEFASQYHFTASYASQLNAIIRSEDHGMPLLDEPLTDRELDILRLLAGGLSNAEIAEKLVISVGTVKQHNHAIFGKLDVRTRKQAVERARNLHLL